MPKFVLRDVEFTINTDPDGTGTVEDLSSFVQSITLNIEVDTPEATAMGDRDRVRLHGLRQWSMEVTFFQDFDEDSVDSLLWNVIDNDLLPEITAMANKTDGIGAANPKYTGRAILPAHQPVAGSIGEVSTISVTFQSAGQLTRATA